MAGSVVKAMKSQLQEEGGSTNVGRQISESKILIIMLHDDEQSQKELPIHTIRSIYSAGFRYPSHSTCKTSVRFLIDTSSVMIKLTHRRVLCTVLLGLWLAVTPFILGYRVHDRWYMHTAAEPGAFVYRCGQQRRLVQCFDKDEAG